ncbi:DUF4810 domain-containing protein [Betaproteobacteria bacterium]|nr:DUF4810 domain-containing protein [Betaproteobacteria bacterium]
MKIMRRQTRVRALPAFVLVFVFAAFLSGCATAPPTLYQWESYEAQVYAHLKGESPEAQIEVMERDLEKIKAGDKTPPPGFYAHLGLLYVESGNDAKAIDCFTTEKGRFPESAPFMNFLLGKYKK